MGSITPTIVVKNGEPILVTGTYGSAFIPSLVFNVVTNVVPRDDAPAGGRCAADVGRGAERQPAERELRATTHDQRPGRSSDLTAVASLEVHYNRRERLPPS
jgi:gamma-glutamyltranspeptidase